MAPKKQDCHHYPSKGKQDCPSLPHSNLPRFHAFLLYLGYTAQAAREVRIMQFCHTLREFALEYRTCRERVLQQQKKRATYRERNKTRGRMITEVVSLLDLNCQPLGPFPYSQLTLIPSLDREVLRCGRGNPQQSTCPSGCGEWTRPG